MLVRLLFALMLAGAAPAAADPAAKPAIARTITAQIEAFLADDAETAFGFAATGIRERFGTPERFAEMVREGYPMVWRPADVRFLELREIQGNLYQRVMIRDAAGRLHLLDYAMRQTDRGWRIRGVQLLRPPEAGA
jgi:hypothetical protein